MSCTRFEQISRYLHLCNSAEQVPYGQPGYDPLFKLRKLLDLITSRLQSVYNPHEEMSVDQAMIPFKGRLGFKQYMKAKPTKWGIKVFVLADATNGYVYRLQIYTGKNRDLQSGTTDTGLCSRVVLELLDGIMHTHPKVYMDNYYTSPWLFLDLYDKGVNACGTVRTNRKYYPQDLVVKATQVERGHYDYRSSGPLLACVWRDKRMIHFLTTIHVAEPSSEPNTVRRITIQDDRVMYQLIVCPPCVPDYQQFMRGVDVGDQMMGYYQVA